MRGAGDGGGAAAGDTLVYALSGDLDSFTGREILVPALKEAFEARGAKSLVLDLSEVEFIDSAGFGTLMGAGRKAVERGGVVVLAAPKKSVERALRISALDRFLVVAESVEAALGKVP
jgi:anti-sigma B factor antagonist